MTSNTSNTDRIAHLTAEVQALIRSQDVQYVPKGEQAYQDWFDRNLDIAFIDLESSDRQEHIEREAQQIVEHYVPTQVPVLSMPTLYCMGHGVEHICSYQHTVAADLGVCDLSLIKDTERYVHAERVQVMGEVTYTGRIERAEA